MIEKVDETSKDEMVNFLKTHEEYTLFLLGNLEVYGLQTWVGLQDFPPVPSVNYFLSS